MITYNQSFMLAEKVKKAVARVREASNIASGEPLWCATSKGKDSVVLESICELAGVRYEKHLSHTSVDAAELIHFAKQDKTLQIDVPRWTTETPPIIVYTLPSGLTVHKPLFKSGDQMTMWDLIVYKKFPPTRIKRYCCEKLKESFGIGYITLTGVRWAESENRSNNQDVVNMRATKKQIEKYEGKADFEINKSGGVIMNLDNDENRRMMEFCYRTRKTLVNPIVDWSTDEVWQFIHDEKVAFCDLYQCGYKRLGCIGCPMNRKAKKELEQNPIYKQNYISAFDKMLTVMEEPATTWHTGQDVYNWWVAQ
jgi:phosphoadenosine phosphosulfate reductase